MADVIILGIETATARAGVAIGTDDGVIAAVEVTRGPRHAEVLVPAIAFACDQAGIALREVDVIAVDIGPGLFTGLRVGIATANGLAQALRLPMVGVCSLDVIAQPMRHGGREIISVIDARRKEVYAARYAVVETHRLKRTMEPTVMPPADLVAQIGDAVLVGDTLADDGAVFALPSVATLVELARDVEPVDPGAIAPLYLRKSDAELHAERGPGGS
ncbi:MAG TPA: tRNA (adenosine(37)-N6)-threonylcarbamoyltransferase complex dimerization subunit type 1 TsaB [Acidimicrobiales bacterium]|nr:tRNA (adenosine(37)-N6)-threonylcarbamoyltransferase complex dimerization subunit type 1 TsaB [Acidimicrobiales bacterium]